MTVTSIEFAPSLSLPVGQVFADRCIGYNGFVEWGWSRPSQIRNERSAFGEHWRLLRIRTAIGVGFLFHKMAHFLFPRPLAIVPIFGNYLLWCQNIIGIPLLMPFFRSLRKDADGSRRCYHLVKLLNPIPVVSLPCIVRFLASVGPTRTKYRGQERLLHIRFPWPVTSNTCTSTSSTRVWGWDHTPYWSTNRSCPTSRARGCPR